MTTKKLLKVADKAYIAGFIDGEGCFTVMKREAGPLPYWKPTCQIANTNLPVLKYIKKFFGGTIHSHNAKSAKAHWKPRYGLHMSPGPLKKLLEAIHPYLREKAKVAKLVNEFPRRRRGYPADLKGIERQRKAVAAIRKLNQRGKIKA